MNDKKKLLIIGTMWPEPKSSAAGSRMLQLIDFFLGINFKITFSSAAAESNFMFNLSEINVEAQSIVMNSDTFDTFIKNINPDVVLFDRFITEEQFGWRVAENCPAAMRILDTEDLHCLRLARQSAIRDNREFTNNDLFSDTAKREIASILRCDLSLIISKFELELLQNNFNVKSELLHYLPFMLNEISEETTINWLPFAQRENYVFIGNFFHEPNWDAVLTLKTKIWPLIKKLQPTAIIEIYGAYPSQKVFDLHNQKDGFLIKGRARDAIEIISKARVLLAPIRFGAGIKGKLVEAKFCGTPSVTTTIGAEAMSDNKLWNGFVADDYKCFAEAAVLLYNDETQWMQSQKNGIEIYNSRYLKSELTPIFKQNFQNIYENLEEHRLKNFIGAMLLHHTLRSTKYMSKWIEEKNKNSK